MGNAERTDPRINVSDIRDASARRAAVVAETERLARQDAEEEGAFMNVAQQVLAELSDLKVEVAKINAGGTAIVIADHEARIRVLEKSDHRDQGGGLALEGWRAWMLAGFSAAALFISAVTLALRVL